MAAGKRRFTTGLRRLMLPVPALGPWMGRKVHGAREQRAAAGVIEASGGFVHLDLSVGRITPAGIERPKAAMSHPKTVDRPLADAAWVLTAAT